MSQQWALYGRARSRLLTRFAWLHTSPPLHQIHAALLCGPQQEHALVSWAQLQLHFQGTRGNLEREVRRTVWGLWHSILFQVWRRGTPAELVPRAGEQQYSLALPDTPPPLFASPPCLPLLLCCQQTWQEKCQNDSETANWILANTKVRALQVRFLC